MIKIARGLAADRMWDVVWENFRDLIAVPFLSGKVLQYEGTGVGSGSVTLTHGLGRQINGFLVQRNVGCFVSETSSDAESITFLVSAVASTWSFTARVF